MSYKIISTADKLPQYRKRILVWVPKSEKWTVAFLHEADDQYGDYFILLINLSAWYLKDGHTVWTELPPAPKSLGKEHQP